MIFEIAAIEVRPGTEQEFEQGVDQALPLFRRANGFRSIRLERVIEAPSRYRLVVGWETLDDHIVHFRNSDDFRAWRSLVGHLFAGPPQVDHSAVVLGDDDKALG